MSRARGADVQKDELSLHGLCSTAHGHREVVGGGEGRRSDGLLGSGRERCARWCNEKRVETLVEWAGRAKDQGVRATRGQMIRMRRLGRGVPEAGLAGGAALVLDIQDRHPARPHAALAPHAPNRLHKDPESGRGAMQMPMCLFGVYVLYASRRAGRGLAGTGLRQRYAPQS